jgi:hypothetical protein
VHEGAFGMGIVLREEEKVSKVGNASYSLDDHVDVGGVLEIIEANSARYVLCPVNTAGILDFEVEILHRIPSEGWVEIVLNVGQRRVGHLVENRR